MSRLLKIMSGFALAICFAATDASAQGIPEGMQAVRPPTQTLEGPRFASVAPLSKILAPRTWGLHEHPVRSASVRDADQLNGFHCPGKLYSGVVPQAFSESEVQHHFVIQIDADNG